MAVEVGNGCLLTDVVVGGGGEISERVGLLDASAKIVVFDGGVCGVSSGSLYEDVAGLIVGLLLIDGVTGERSGNDFGLRAEVNTAAVVVGGGGVAEEWSGFAIELAGGEDAVLVVVGDGGVGVEFAGGGDASVSPVVSEVGGAVVGGSVVNMGDFGGDVVGTGAAGTGAVDGFGVDDHIVTAGSCSGRIGVGGPGVVFLVPIIYDSDFRRISSRRTFFAVDFYNLHSTSFPTPCHRHIAM